MPGIATDWPDLVAELDEWGRLGRVATLWWRDDDAVSVTPPLEQALRLSQRYQAPLHLSVIPARMSSEFGPGLTSAAPVSVLQHGYAHAEGELYGDRPQETVLQELESGRQRLSEAFGNRFLPVLVPPWNLIRDEFIPVARKAGLSALSADGPRSARFIEGVEVINTHSGPLAWANGIGRFAGTSESIGRILEHLRARRNHAVDRDEPTGFCTHHLIIESDTWDFLDRLLAETTAHRAARWIQLSDVLQSAS